MTSTLDLCYTEVLCKTFPNVATDFLVFLPSFNEFFFYRKSFFFVYSKRLPHKRCSSTNSLPPPKSSTSSMQFFFFLVKMPLVALESHSIFGKSALAAHHLWLQIYYPTIKALFLTPLHMSSDWAFCLTHPGWSFSARSVCKQPESLPQFVGLAIEVFNSKIYFTVSVKTPSTVVFLFGCISS